MSTPVEDTSLLDSLEKFAWTLVPREQSEALPHVKGTYMFSENLTFGTPASSREALHSALVNYRLYLETLGQLAMVQASELVGNRLPMIMHGGEKNTQHFGQVLEAIERILEGHESMLPYLNNAVPADQWGEKMVAVNVKGTLIVTKEAGAVELSAQLLAGTRDPKRGRNPDGSPVFRVTSVLSDCLY